MIYRRVHKHCQQFSWFVFFFGTGEETKTDEYSEPALNMQITFDRFEKYKKAQKRNHLQIILPREGRIEVAGKIWRALKRIKPASLWKNSSRRF